MSTVTYVKEKQIAIAAVRRACSLTASVFNKLVKNETLTKGDKSPVTGRKALFVHRLDNLTLNPFQSEIMRHRQLSVRSSTARFLSIPLSVKKMLLIYARNPATDYEIG